MDYKFLEIRDRATFIPALALRFDPQMLPSIDSYLVRRAGFGPIPYVFLVHLENSSIEWDPYAWTGSRTMREAHFFLREHWSSIESGDVIDVEFVLGETTAPKTSER